MALRRNLGGSGVLLVVCLALAILGAEGDPELNGFRLDGLRVPRGSIRGGGPPRNGIPSVDDPQFVAAEGVTWVGPGNLVLGVAMGEDARAYPVHLIERHQVVNDMIGGVPVVVTYDPLAGTPISYRRKLGERTLGFGVSGLLHQSNFLLYDRETESLWSQFTGQAIAGPLAGRVLERVVTRQETLESWLARYPRSRVLVRPLPRKIDYRHSPYQSYWTQNKVLFPVPTQDRRFHAKELVLGVAAAGKSRAYLGSLVTGAGGKVEDQFAGHPIRFRYDSSRAMYRWEIPADVRVTEAYWFAWKAFQPDTEVWRDPGPGAAVAD